MLGLYWLALAAAAVSDLRYLRISNALAMATLVTAVLVLLFVRDAAGPWWQHLASFAIMLAIGFALFSAGWIGGGDAKFAAGAAVLFDLRELLWFVEAVAVSGGLLTLILIVVRRLLPEGKGRWLGIQKGRSIPYGVAIALGAAAASVGLASA